MAFQLLIRAFVGGLVLTLAAAAYLFYERNNALIDHIAALEATSIAYKKTIEKKIAQTEQEYEQSKTDIDSRYNSVLAKLRDAENNRLRADRASAQCQSERRADADRMRSDMLRAYATVARYADKIRARGLACEKILDSGL